LANVALTPTLDQPTEQPVSPWRLRDDGRPHAAIASRSVPWSPLVRRPPSSEMWRSRTLIVRSAAGAEDGTASAAKATARASRRGPVIAPPRLRGGALAGVEARGLV
jgi:hypothetical protein